MTDTTVLRPVKSKKTDCFVFATAFLLVIVVHFLYPVLSQNNRGGWSYLILLLTVLTPNLLLERLLASHAFSPTFLLCSIIAVSQVFFGPPHFLVPFTPRSNAILTKLS